MKKKFSILFFAGTLISYGAMAQDGNKKDSSQPAKEIIVKDWGEKDLSKKLKEDQIRKSPGSLVTDSLNNSKEFTNRAKDKHCRHKKVTQ
jgi:hypothetical protein